MRYAIFLAFLLVLGLSGALTTTSLAQDADQAPASMPAGYPTSVAEAIATSNEVSRSTAIQIDRMQDLMNQNIGATSTDLNAIGITQYRAETLLAGCKSFLATATAEDAAALRNNLKAAEALLEELDRMAKKFAERGTII